MEHSSDEETGKLDIFASSRNQPPHLSLTRRVPPPARSSHPRRRRRGKSYRFEKRNAIHPGQGFRRKANYFDHYTPVFTIRHVVVVGAESSYFFFWAFSAALVTFPEASLKLTALMTPTATVWRMSRTAKRPRGGNSWNASTHIGLLGTKLTIAASPDLMALGFSSVVLPVRRSHFSLISANLHAMWAVWQSRTGVYPLLICPGWFRTITCKGTIYKLDNIFIIFRGISIIGNYCCNSDAFCHQRTKFSGGNRECVKMFHHSYEQCKLLNH